MIESQIRIFQVSLILLFLFLSIIQYVVPDTEAVGDPEVTIKFLEGEDKQAADVRPGEHGTVVFPGVVEARIPMGSSVQDIMVVLIGFTGEGWAVTINPESIQIDPGGTALFKAIVTVPSETSSDVIDTLTVEGTATAYPSSSSSNVPPVYGTILVEQYFKFGLSCKEPVRDLGYDEQQDFDLVISNLGNGMDQYTIEIENSEKLLSKDISATPLIKTITVKENSITTVKINVDIGHSSDSVGKNDIEVVVFSEKEMRERGRAFSKVYPLQIVVTAPTIVERISEYRTLIILILIVIIITGLYVRKKRKYGY